MTRGEYDAQWRQKNREKIREYKKKWLAERPGYQAGRKKKWVAANKERVRASERARELRAYGLTAQDYASMFRAQHGACAICFDPPGRISLHVDHCHSTGRVRGLLCSKCNLMLGNARDTPSILLSAISYLGINQ